MFKTHIDTKGQKVKLDSGIKRTIRYDRDGRKIGETLEHVDREGFRTLEYYDRDGRKVGDSRETHCCKGFKRIEHFDRDGRKTGEEQIEIRD